MALLTEAAEPAVRELAWAAQRYAEAAEADGSDFESVYNHGLTLQELALRAGSSREEQLELLQQVLPWGKPCTLSLINSFVLCSLLRLSSC